MYRLPPPSCLIPVPLRFLLGVVSLLVVLPLLLPTRPPIVLSFFGDDFAASRLTIRKRPSIESYVAPAGENVDVSEKGNGDGVV